MDIVCFIEFICAYRDKHTDISKFIAVVHHRHRDASCREHLIVKHHIVALGMIGTVDTSSVICDELVERVADVTCCQVIDLILRLDDLHCSFVEYKRHICLVACAASVWIHLVAGVDIYFPVYLGESARACIERGSSVCAFDADVVFFLPVLCVACYAQYFDIVFRIRVFLTCDNIVVVDAEIDAAEQRKLGFYRVGRKQLGSTCRILFDGYF